MTASPALARLAESASIEVTPRDAGGLAELGGLLPPGTPIYITSLPGADPADIVPAAVAVREAGHEPVPHLAVRNLPDLDAVDRLLAHLTAEAAVVDVLVIAGSPKSAVGGLHSSLEVLESGLLERHGILRAGVAGHPEGSPDIPPAAAAAALAAKNAYAERSPLELRVVTQFALSAEPYVAWEREVRRAGNRLPVVAGLPGVTSPPKLLRFALACGVGPSVEILRKQAGGLVKLATTRSWTPDAVAEGIARAAAADPESRFAGLHLFPFGGVRASAEWLARVRTGAAVV